MRTPSAPIAAVILAAGGSRRMGRSKALLELEGESFVARAARLAREAIPGPRIVVCGAEAEAVRIAAADADARFIVNERWREGMGTSIACGVEALEDSDVSGVAILLIDQPRLDRSHLETLVATFLAGRDPVATSHGGRPGPPALFGRRWFDDLRRLRGDRGGREILDRAGAVLVEPGIDPGDLDTPDEYARLGK